MSRDLRNPLDAKAPSTAELAAENAALRAQLKFNETRLQAEEAKTAGLRKVLQTQEDYIAWLVKQLQGPLSERRSWESLAPEAQLWLQGMALEIPDSPPPPKTTVKEHERQRRKKPTDVLKTGRIKHGPNATIIDVDVKKSEVDDVPILCKACPVWASNNEITHDNLLFDATRLGHQSVGGTAVETALTTAAQSERLNLFLTLCEGREESDS